MKRLYFLLFLSILTSGLIYSQDTINVPADYTTIQAAIYASSNGDIVLVEEGTYYENIKYKGKAITVASHFLIDGDTSHITNTIINGSQPPHPDSGSVVFFDNGEDTTSVLCGFTITGGTGTYSPQFDDRSGGGIYLYPSGGKICNNIIENNSTSYNPYAFGGGIIADVQSHSLVIENNIIRNNTTNANTETSGGAIAVWPRNYARIFNNIIINNSVNGSAFTAGGGISCNIATDKTYIMSNIIKGNNTNSEIGGGGGINVYIGSPVIINNLIINNTASTGGGILVELGQAVLNKIRTGEINGSCLLQRSNVKNVNSLSELLSDFTVIANNTISGNSATVYSGGGITISGPPVNIMNAIIWNNYPADSQIEGSALVTYSDVEGGYTGSGNIKLDPDFTDTLNYYLNVTSPCLDAGNSDSAYNDIEDPNNPGFALWPALGTLRNDMGAYGGHLNTQIQTELLGPQFREFVNRVNSASYTEKQTIVDSFMNAAPSFPFIEENTIVYFIYQGAASTVNVPGDANNWNTTVFSMTNLEATNLWYGEAVFESDARLDYKFYINGSQWILDPLNPNTVSGGYGPNSELAMPDYIQPLEIDYYPNIPHGEITSFPFTSTILNNTRTIKVYTPFNYAAQTSDHFPVMLFHDGLEYLTLGSAANILDYLIALSKIDPVICVFVPPVDRNNEYAYTKTQQFETFIADELMPHIDSTYRTLQDPAKRGMAGLSYGGLITTQICYDRPEIFGLAAPYSPSYWAKNMEVFNLVLSGPQKEIDWYLDWGTYETSITLNARAMKDGLISKNYDIEWNEWHEGHSWGSWRAHLDNALEYFFPVTVDVEERENVTQEFMLAQNYPNPFNPSTKIKYSIPQSSKVLIKIYDILGNELETLINEEKPAGMYELTWSANNLPSGVYFYHLRAGDFIQTKKMILLK